MHQIVRLNLFAKITERLRSAALLYKFGFVDCHSYLNDHELAEIKTMLETKNEGEKQNAILEFEERFSKLVGSGSSSSFASGRMAFYSFMEVLNITHGDEVILTAFTCSVMVNAIMKRGATPVYSDVDSHTFGSSAIAIEKVITRKTKLIIAQHSFGIPCDIEPIIRLAKEHGVPVIEDCAISLDSSINGIKVGNWGDAAIFSFDHSKPLNTIIGGILYTRDPEIHEQVNRISRVSPSLSLRHQKNLYDQMIFEKKHYTPNRYPRAEIYSKLRRIWARICMSNKDVFFEENNNKPSSNNESYPYPAKLPAFLALLGTFELDRWDEKKIRRKKLLSSMVSIIQRSEYCSYLSYVYNDPTRNIVPLRFVFSGDLSHVLLQKINQYIDGNWIWFRQPIVGATDGLENIGYINGSCDVSEKTCSTIINFPCNITKGYDQLLLTSIENTFIKLKNNSPINLL